jgi:hypothetical protein
MDLTQSRGLGFSAQAQRLKYMTQAQKKDKKQNFLNLIQAHEEQIKNLETKL